MECMMVERIPMKTIAVGALLLVSQCLASPPPGVYVPPPEFVEPGTDDPRDAARLIEGTWTTKSDGVPFSFEIARNKFRVLRSNCEWLEWEWLNSTYEPIDGNLVLSKFTIRVVGKSFTTACLDVPLAIYIVFVSPPNRDVAEVAVNAGTQDEQVLVMARHP
jgi:hypothetical protein